MKGERVNHHHHHRPTQLFEVWPRTTCSRKICSSISWEEESAKPSSPPANGTGTDTANRCRAAREAPAVAWLCSRQVPKSPRHSGSSERSCPPQPPLYCLGPQRAVKVGGSWQRGTREHNKETGRKKQEQTSSLGPIHAGRTFCSRFCKHDSRKTLK